MTEMEQAHKEFSKLEKQATSLKTAQDKLQKRGQTWRTLANQDTINHNFGYEYVFRGETVLAKLSSLASDSLEEAFVLSIIIQDYFNAGKLPEKHLEECKKHLNKSHIYTNDYAREITKLENEIGIHYIENED